MTRTEKAAIDLREWFNYRSIPDEWVKAGLCDALYGFDENVPKEMIDEYRMSAGSTKQER